MAYMNKELSDYLKSKHGLDRLFTKLKDKYISLGTYSGTVRLDNITKIESIDIGNLLGKRIEEGSTIKTSFREITKKIEQGKFSGFCWEELFKYYFKDKVISNKDKKEQASIEETEFFQNLLDKNKHHKYIEYLKKIINEQDDIYKTMRARYKKDKKELEKEVHNILKLLDNIQKTPVSLPVFASITGNPHYLDFNRSESNLFFRVLSSIKNTDYPLTTQDRATLLSEINVYMDPISNFVITYKLTGDSVLDELDKRRQVVNLNLLNINQIENIDTKDKKVFIFENPSILNTLMDLDVPMIITSGIPNLALYRLLEKLDINKNEMYYNGDFDPEGLLIAEKLRSRFPKIKLFCYEKDDYLVAKSQEEINSSRLKKLDSITSSELAEMKTILLEEKVAGYQEKNMKRIEEYIRNMRNFKKEG